MLPHNAVFVFDIADAEHNSLDDEALIRDCLREIVDAAGLTVLGDVTHHFRPHGVSIAILLAESHIAAHTWPEHGTAYVTLTTCRTPPASFAAAASELLRRSFGAGSVDVRSLD